VLRYQLCNIHHITDTRSKKEKSLVGQIKWSALFLRRTLTHLVEEMLGRVGSSGQVNMNAGLWVARQGPDDVRVRLDVGVRRRVPRFHVVWGLRLGHPVAPPLLLLRVFLVRTVHRFRLARSEKNQGTFYWKTWIQSLVLKNKQMIIIIKEGHDGQESNGRTLLSRGEKIPRDRKSRES
jgi:hypothetical protein